MNTAKILWTVRTGAAIAATARWIAFTSAMLFMLVATAQQRLSVHANSWWWWTITLLMLLQIYFAMRADFDRRIFEQLAVEPETIQASLIAFDEALASAGITRHRTRGRPIGERIRGTASLVRRMGYVLILQFLIAALSSALPQ